MWLFILTFFGVWMHFSARLFSFCPCARLFTRHMALSSFHWFLYSLFHPFLKTKSLLLRDVHIRICITAFKGCLRGILSLRSFTSSEPTSAVLSAFFWPFFSPKHIPRLPVPFDHYSAAIVFNIWPHFCLFSIVFVNLWWTTLTYDYFSFSSNSLCLLPFIVQDIKKIPLLRNLGHFLLLFFYHFCCSWCWCLSVS